MSKRRKVSTPASERLRRDVVRSRVRVDAKVVDDAGPPMVLIKDALDDLRYIEPKRAADRVISCLNELFLRVNNIEHMHAPERENDAAKAKKKR